MKLKDFCFELLYDFALSTPSILWMVLAVQSCAYTLFFDKSNSNSFFLRRVIQFYEPQYSAAGSFALLHANLRYGFAFLILQFIFLGR